MTDSQPSAPEAAESATAQTQAPAESSGAETSTSATPTDDQGAKAPASVFDAVNAALKQQPAAPEGSPASDSPGTEAPESEDDKPLSDEVTQDELNRYHSRTRKRIQQLLDKGKTQSAEIGRLSPLAKQAERINQFVQSSGLNWDEVNSGFELMRLMKTNPMGARKQLEPIWEALNKACGFELPPDLKQKVDLGYVDETTARELAQERARANLAANANKRTAAQIQQAQEAAAHQRFGDGVKSAVKTFEENWKRSDPDFAVTHPRVMEKVELTLARMAKKGEALSSPADAVKIIEEAKSAVENELRRILPKREPINPLPGGGVTASGNPKPRSMADAVAMGLRM